MTEFETEPEILEQVEVEDNCYFSVAGGVLQLLVDQLKQQLLQRGIDPSGRPKPQLQLELLQVLKLEIALPKAKVCSVEEAQIQSKRNSCRLS